LNYFEDEINELEVSTLVIICLELQGGDSKLEEVCSCPQHAQAEVPEGC
jgi:hypothetical protein